MLFQLSYMYTIIKLERVTTIGKFCSYKMQLQLDKKLHMTTYNYIYAVAIYKYFATKHF